MPGYTTREISERLGGELRGSADLRVTGVQPLDEAGEGDISFIRDEHYAARWGDSRATAAVASRCVPDLPASGGRAIIRVDDADVAMAKVLEMFAPPPPPALVETGAGEAAEAGDDETRIDPRATVAASASVGRGCRIGPNCVVAAGVVIGPRTVLYPNVTILDGSRIGAACVFWPGVVVRERCVVGDRCELHPNVTLGADGFGYRPAVDGRGLVKIPHIGTVEVGDDVEIGAGTCVDRGKFAATTIGSGSKIDNLCQIAHNCRLGRCCVLAGQVGLAGSVTLGDGVVMGGKVAVKDHVVVGAGAALTGCSAVMGDVPAGETWGGVPAREMRLALREHAALRKLPDIIRAMKKP